MTATLMQTMDAMQRELDAERRAWEPGIYPNLSHAEYMAIPALNASALKQFHRSPAHYQQWLKEPRRESDALLFGSVSDCLILTPNEFNSRFRVRPECPHGPNPYKWSGGAKGERKLYEEHKAKVEEWEIEWQSGLPAGCIPISEDLFAAAVAARSAVMQHGIASHCATTGYRQLVLVVRDEDTGLLLKCAIDAVPAAPMGFGQAEWDMLVDFKSTMDARRRPFQRAVAAFGYHIQAAFYLRLWNRLCPEAPKTRWLWVVYESAAPYGVKAYPAHSDLLLETGMLVDRLIKRYAECAEKDQWPCYALKAEPALDLPPWAEEDPE
jgi:hypothetical protein